MAKKAQKKTKRLNGEGALRQRPNGSWELTIMDGFKEDGRRRYKSFYGRSQREVKDKLIAYQNGESEGHEGFDFADDYTFRDWANIWFDSHQDGISPTTREGYRYTLRILNRFFENKKIRTIKAFDVEIMLKTLQREGRSPSGLAQCRGMMYQIMNKAEANDLITKNPVRFAEKMRHTGPVQKKESFTAEEMTCLMRELPFTKIGISMRLMLGTGMRTQEILALEPRHISEDGAVIQIRQAINMVKGTVMVGPPKSRDSYRDVPVPVNLRKYAITLREAGEQFVWESPKNPGQPVNPSYFRDQFKKTLEGIQGVRVLTPHCCRHTYVSQMQALGVDLATIQSIVGHADIDMTKHYLHVQRDVQERAIQRFSEMFSDVGNAD